MIEPEQYSFDLMPAQYRALLEINKYIDLKEKIIILSGLKGSGKTFLLKYLLKIYDIENNYLIHNHSEQRMSPRILESFEFSKMIAVDDGGFDKEWFRNLRIDLRIHNIQTAIVSTTLAFIDDIPVINLELTKDDIEVFAGLHYRLTGKVIDEKTESLNLWEFIHT